MRFIAFALLVTGATVRGDYTDPPNASTCDGENTFNHWTGSYNRCSTQTGVTAQCCYFLFDMSPPAPSPRYLCLDEGFTQGQKEGKYNDIWIWTCQWDSKSEYDAAVSAGTFTDPHYEDRGPYAPYHWGVELAFWLVYLTAYINYSKLDYLLWIFPTLATLLYIAGGVYIGACLVYNAIMLIIGGQG